MHSWPKLKEDEQFNEWAFAADNLLVMEGTANFIKKMCSQDAGSEDAEAKAELILTIDPSLYVHIKIASSTRNLSQNYRICSMLLVSLKE